VGPYDLLLVAEFPDETYTGWALEVGTLGKHPDDDSARLDRGEVSGIIKKARL